MVVKVTIVEFELGVVVVTGTVVFEVIVVVIGITVLSEAELGGGVEEGVEVLEIDVGTQPGRENCGPVSG